MTVLSTQVQGVMSDGSLTAEKAKDRREAEEIAKAMRANGYVVVKIIEHVE